MKNRTIFIISLMLMVVFSCSVQNEISQHSNTTTTLNKSQQQKLDSILQRGLDFEALYTMVGKIKPMSSVASFSFPIANTDSLKRVSGNVLDLSNKQEYLDKIAELNTLLNTLNYPDLKFIMFPFQQAYKGQKTLQLSVIRVSLLDSLLQAKATFFGQFGLVPGVDPAVVVSTIEGSAPHERFRAYGYLFGYPEYAVNFFVEAFDWKEKNDEFVERNFFQIPTFSSDTGAFVYAYPKDHTPTKTDSTLYFRAQSVLSDYKELRKDYLNKDKTLQSRKFLNTFFTENN